MSHVIVYTLGPCDFFLRYGTDRVKFHRVADASDKIARVSYLVRRPICNLLHWTIFPKVETSTFGYDCRKYHNIIQSSPKLRKHCLSRKRKGNFLSANEICWRVACHVYCSAGSFHEPRTTSPCCPWFTASHDVITQNCEKMSADYVKLLLGFI